MHDQIIFFIFKQPSRKSSLVPEALGDSNQSFENDDGSIQSFGSITRILKKDKKTLKRMKTLSAEEFEKKSRNEMMLALFLYTFECISVTAFSAIMIVTIATIFIITIIATIITFALVNPLYGLSAKLKTSHIVTPKLQTSDLWLNS